jgi:hypothetical protein
MVTLDEIAALARTLPRSEEAIVHGRLKFRMRSMVWLAFSADGTQLGFAFPKEMREALVATYPEKYLMPKHSDLRFNWVVVRLAAIEPEEMRDIVLDAWRMVVPKKVALAQAARDDHVRSVLALDQLEHHPACGLRRKERDLRIAIALHPGVPHALAIEVGEVGVHIGRFEGEAVEPLAARIEEAPELCFSRQGRE